MHPIRRLGHRFAHVLIFTLRLLAAICSTAGKKAYPVVATATQSNIFSIVAVIASFCAGSSPGTPRFDIKFVRLTVNRFGTMRL